jgi:hypothetical protein
MTVSVEDADMLPAPALSDLLKGSTLLGAYVEMRALLAELQGTIG